MPPLLYEKKGPIAYITFNRPEARNALDPETIVRLAAAWTDFAEDQDLRVAIVTGAGDVSFSAGADLMRLIPLVTRARQPDDDWDRQVLGDPSMVQRALIRPPMTRIGPLTKEERAALIDADKENKHKYCKETVVEGAFERIQAMNSAMGGVNETLSDMKEKLGGWFGVGRKDG